MLTRCKNRGGGKWV